MPSTKSNSKPKADLPEPAVEWSFEAIGTVWWIGLYDLPFGLNTAGLRKKVMARIEGFDRKYSRFREESLVYGWSRSTGQYPLPAEALPMLDFYHQLYEASSGAVTPLIGGVMAGAGYDAQYSLRPKPGLVSPPTWEAALEYGDGFIEIKQPVLLDFGAAGKGYLVDIVAGILESAGIRQYCIDAGGDIRYGYATKSGDAIRIGLEHPDDPLQVIGFAELGGVSAGSGRWRAICGSAGNRRAWGGFHHIIDPQELVSPQHIKAVWVAAESTMLADGLATALYFVKPKGLTAKFRFAYAVVHTDNSLSVSRDFPGRFF